MIYPTAIYPTINYKSSLLRSNKPAKVEFGGREGAKHESSTFSCFFRDLHRPYLYENLKGEFTRIFDAKEKPKMLLIGLGRLQESFTYLSILSEMKNHQPFEKYLDLNCVELRPEISGEEADKLSSFRTPFYDYYPKSSFIIGSGDSAHKVKPHITKYLKNVISDPEKTHWNTDIVKFADEQVKKDDDQRKKYDVISCNSVLQYVEPEEGRPTIINLVKMLNPGGILITTHTIKTKNFNKSQGSMQNGINKKVLENVGNGIYKKVGEIKRVE